jgi:RNA polymerase sigma factor (sigma-70 family)
MEREKFEEILQKEGKKIFNYLLKILRNRSDAEDLLQEVFIAFYKKMDTINENAFSSYLFKIRYESQGKLSHLFVFSYVFPALVIP